MTPDGALPHRSMSLRRLSERTSVAAVQKDGGVGAQLAGIVSYRVISCVSARPYSEHMSAPGYPPAPGPGIPTVPGWSAGPGVGRASPASGTSIPQRGPTRPPYAGYPAYPEYPAYSAYPSHPAHSTPPAPAAHPATSAAAGPRYWAPVPVAPHGGAPAVPTRTVPSLTASLSPSQRRALEVFLAVLRSVSLFALCLLGSLSALGSRFGHEQVLRTSNPALDVMGFLAGLMLLVAVFLRRRWPTTVTVASALAGVAVYLDTTVGIIAFTTVVRRARSLRDPVLWATGALLTIATLVALLRDASHGSTGNSVIGMLTSGSRDPHTITHVSTPQVLFLTVVAMALPIAVGLWLRARDGEKEAQRHAREAADATVRAERTAQEQARTSNRLADTVSLQAERERVAREVHDGLGHRLSLLALHAAALERGVLMTPESSDSPDRVGTPDEDSPQAAAQRVREEAQGAMQDLRSLLAVLREPVGAAEPAPRLEDLKEVVDGVLAARQPLSSSIYLDRAAEADEVLSRAVYRIVQESLTNARKHSPGMSVQLRVEGGPDTGIDITCSNQCLCREPATGPGPQTAEAHGVSDADDTGSGGGSGSRVLPDDARGGSGLAGMARRAEICGGTFHAGPDGRGRFVVSVHLPWRSAAPSRGDH